MVSISVVFKVTLPVFATPPASGLSISISTTSPSMISVSSLMRTPMALRKACVKASVFDISREKISEAAIMAKGVSSPRALAMPMAIAVLPVPGCPASSTARPAILPSRIMFRMTPAALRARACPTMPCDTALASRASSRPRPRMWECAPIRSMRVRSLTVPSTLTSPMLLLRAWYFSRHFQRRMVRLTTKTVIYVDTLRQKVKEIDFNLEPRR
mmetsp:Transcript_14481/g.39212  ORF Transcript_14481/g.39212 Transcript_14481/m.39212 type:complete len:214 (-) Transcript_14481:33-674(-)